jgi:hypothetical protein
MHCILHTLKFFSQIFSNVILSEDFFASFINEHFSRGEICSIGSSEEIFDKVFSGEEKSYAKNFPAKKSSMRKIFRRYGKKYFEQ